MAAYPRNNGNKPGTWKPMVDAGIMSATFVCPKCGKITPLTGSIIDGGGAVNPDFVCPSFDFRESIVLEGWPF